ncbi:DEAD/DEAH box helicase [Paenisporosarcina indica]|uniref:DEAD/DEAH box helicase n=1 Tax=Paenisporosarcina indica TaxID=650093 RepID=UPI0009FBEC0B|nr:DEAD/DEAH box helicase [Paenisporosarcina indica]
MKEVQEFLSGRIWLKEETPFPLTVIDMFIRKGFITPHKGIQSNYNSLISQKEKNQCRRCGNKKLITFQCAKCNGPCQYCRHCIRMGRVSSCTELITWSGPLVESSSQHTFNWTGTLTVLQAKASRELLHSVLTNQSHLVHAVCGAGKTELLFPAIFELLTHGQRVCIATPRTDVVLELAPRFQQVFPNTVIHALYGGAPENTNYAQLIIATTHQLLRFEEGFDVVFVDEADAFPFTMDEALQYAVQKAKKQQAVVHYITATPSDELVQQVKNISLISERFHGFSLPVPRFDGLWNYSKHIKKEKLSPKLQKWTQQCLDNKLPFLVFFPTIELMEQATPLFQRLHKEIVSVHAEDAERKLKVLKLREKKVPGLLTTTILERGITIPNVQVAVVGADEAIFTSSALIQIGGRVGRSIEYPTGDLVFFHHGISFEMDQAKSIIRAHNAKREKP